MELQTLVGCKRRQDAYSVDVPTWDDREGGLQTTEEATVTLTCDGPHPPSSRTFTEYYYIPRVHRGEIARIYSVAVPATSEIRLARRVWVF